MVQKKCKRSTGPLKFKFYKNFEKKKNIKWDFIAKVEKMLFKVKILTSVV